MHFQALTCVRNAWDLGFVSFIRVGCLVGLVLLVFKNFFPWIYLEQVDHGVVMVMDCY